MAQLDSLKFRLEITDTEQDTLLQQLLDDAEAAILEDTNREELTFAMQPLQRELAIVYYNRSSASGLKNRSEGGISLTYDTEIPVDIIARLTRYRRLRLVGIANAKK